jgi:nitroimidazol reductase NimA-like FMN-containing flavoprotein (pyridoxamine 5'-phosphate oxidase superfamily)
MTRERLNDLARAIINSNRYMVLGTADQAGHPWVSPVWFASEDYAHFHWVSSPDARHSRNVAARPEVAIAIFDSTVPVGGAQAVYMSGRTEELTGTELERGIEVFGRLSEAATLSWAPASTAASRLHRPRHHAEPGRRPCRR